MNLFKWILNLFDDTPAKSHVIFTQNTKQLTHDQAMKMAKDGWKIKHSEWLANDFAYFEDGVFWRKHDNKKELYLASNRTKYGDYWIALEKVGE